MGIELYIYIIFGLAIYIAIVVTIVSIRIGNRLRRTVTIKTKATYIEKCINAFGKAGWMNVSVTSIRRKPGYVRIKFVR